MQPAGELQPASPVLSDMDAIFASADSAQRLLGTLHASLRQQPRSPLPSEGAEGSHGHKQGHKKDAVVFRDDTKTTVATTLQVIAPYHSSSHSTF